MNEADRMANSDDLIRLLLEEQSDQGLHCFLSVLILRFSWYRTLQKLCIIFRERNILTWFLKVKNILAVFLEVFSNWLRLITLCENFTVFWASGPDFQFMQWFHYLLLLLTFLNTNTLARSYTQSM